MLQTSTFYFPLFPFLAAIGGLAAYLPCMEFVHELIRRLSDLPALVQWAGYIGLATIIFTETGLFVGFFLPGDSLLVTAGLLTSRGLPLSLALLGILLTAAAIVGDNTNYWVGRLSGPRIFRRDDSLFFKRRYVDRAHDFYVRHGPKTVVLARFMPIIRTFAPLVAGVGRMDYRVFLTFSVIGGTAWIWSMLCLGFFLGQYDVVARHIELVILGVILVSILPGFIGWWRERRTARAAAVPPPSSA
jgi:membrane-associated protein